MSMNRSKITKWMLNLLISLVLICVIAAVVSGLNNRDNPRYVPGLGKYKLVSVLSDSMKPVMEAGDAIVVDSSAGRFGAGDVITYWRPHDNQSLLTHRIVKIKQSGSRQEFYTKGDANNVKDGESVKSRDVVGKYMFRIPRGGYFIGFIHTRAGFLALIMLPILMALCLEAKRLYPEVAAMYRK